MKPILIIAPHTKIEYEAKQVAKNYDDVDVRLGLLEQAIEIVKNAQKNGVEAVISRGGTARIIEKTFPEIPVIEIEVSPYDMLSAMYTATKYGKNICIIGFKNIIEGVHLSAPIIGANIKTYHIDDGEDAEEYIKTLINSGERIDALLGGTVAENLALKYKIPTVLLETGATTIDSSIHEARRILSITRKEKEKTEQFKAILHYISEGIISIDRDRRITTFNPAAERMLGVSNKDAVGRVIDEVFPNTRLAKVIEKGEAELSQMSKLGSIQVLTNRVPIILNDQTVGAVATFQDISKIQEYEQQIRAKLLNKGHVAKYSFSDILGESETLLKAKDRARRYARNNSTVLIVGESGTGKEMFAQSIHRESDRRDKPFVAINCAAIPENLLESEFFGYEEGAFTGARKAGKPGLFTEAHGGTIFLDEIGELSIEFQASLLRVIQEREVRPVGSNRVIPIDIRIIAATNKNLLEEVKKGNFRSDLYYRLNILKLRIPTLKERKDDIGLLGRYFIQKISSRYHKTVEISDPALDLLQSYHWPGNIRELENVVERLVALNDERISADAVKEILDEQAEGVRTEGSQSEYHLDLLEEVKKRHIYKVLAESDYNQTVAAKRLGISRTHLWRLINNYQK